MIFLNKYTVISIMIITYSERLQTFCCDISYNIYCAYSFCKRATRQMFICRVATVYRETVSFRMLRDLYSMTSFEDGRCSSGSNRPPLSRSDCLERVCRRCADKTAYIRNQFPIGHRFSYIDIGARYGFVCEREVSNARSRIAEWGSWEMAQKAWQNTPRLNETR